MARHRIGEHFAIDFPNDSPEWERIRHAPSLVDHLVKAGEETVKRCNEDLHAAQAARKQTVEDGYEYEVSFAGDRARLHLWPYTARAIAHEAVNHAILKNIPVGTPPSAVPDHEIPRELASKGGLKGLLDTRKAEAKAKADKKEAALKRRREKAKVKSWLRAEEKWKSSR